MKKNTNQPVSREILSEMYKALFASEKDYSESAERLIIQEFQKRGVRSVDFCLIEWEDVPAVKCAACYENIASVDRVYTEKGKVVVEYSGEDANGSDWLKNLDVDEINDIVEETLDVLNLLDEGEELTVGADGAVEVKDEFTN